MGRQRLRLIFKMAIHRPVDALGTVVIALVLVMVCASLSGFISAYSHAIQRGAQSSFGAYSQQVNGNEDVAAFMRSLQDKGEAVATSYSRQNLLKTNTKKATSVDVTMLSGAGDLGVLVAGRYPDKPGELSVSREVAKRLQAKPGDYLELVDVEQTRKQAAFTLVGITENPASIHEVTAIAISANQSIFKSSEVWLTNNDLKTIDEVLNHGGGNVATVTSVIERANANAVSYQAISPQVASLFLGLIIVVLLVAIYAVDRQRRRSVFQVLTALGDTPGRAALTTCTQTTLLALVGGAIGWILACISLPTVSRWVAAFFEQRWNQVEWTAVSIAALATLVMITLGGILSAGVTVLSLKHHKRAHSERLSPRVLLIVGIAGTVATLLLIVSRQLLIFPLGHRLAMIVGALSIPTLAYALTLFTRKRKVTARLGNRLQQLTLGALAIVFALNYYGALYASGVADWTNWLGRQINGEESYLQVTSATEQAVDNLLERLPQLKPRTAVFGDVSTNEQMFRITDSEGTQCFKTAKSVDDCPQSNLDFIYVASGGLVDKSFINHAPKSYVTNKGAVTLIGIGIADSTITKMSTVGGLIGDRNLENNILSGLVISPDSPLLNQLGVKKPQSYTAIITGFAALPDEVQDEIRANLLIQAPFATITDSEDPQVRQIRAQAVARQLLAVIVSGAILLTLAAALVSNQQIERRLIELTGGSSKIKVRLVKSLLISYTVSVACAVILGRLAAMDRVPFIRLNSAVSHDYGLVWTIGLSSLLFLIPALVIAIRSSNTIPLTGSPKSPNNP